jgi:hypothetical protein
MLIGPATNPDAVDLFVRKHGAPQIRVGDGAWMLADGAMLRTGDPRGTAMVEPPAEPGERLRCIVRYRNELWQRAVNAWRRFRAAGLFGGSERWDERELGPCPKFPDGRMDPRIESALARLEAICAERKASLESAKRELAAVAPYFA